MSGKNPREEYLEHPPSRPGWVPMMFAEMLAKRRVDPNSTKGLPPFGRNWGVQSGTHRERGGDDQQVPERLGKFSTLAGQNSI
jgi:hypothetical protein